MINALIGLLFLASIIHKIIYDWAWLGIYILCFAGYLYIVFTKGVRRDNGKRKTIMFATWNEPNDPTGQFVENTNVTQALEYVEELNKKNSAQDSTKITITHVIGMAIAKGLKEVEEHVGHVQWGNFKKDDQIGCTILVDVDNGADLVPVTIWNAHDISIEEFAKKCNEKAERARKKQDKQHNESTKMAMFLPSFLLQPLISLASYLTCNLQIGIPQMGLEPSPVGQFFLTNVGMLKVKQGFACLCPPTRSTGFCCAGMI